MDDAVTDLQAPRIELRRAPIHWKIVFGGHLFTSTAFGLIGLFGIVSGLGDLGPAGQIPSWQRVGLGVLFLALGLVHVGFFTSPSYQAVRKRDACLLLREKELVLRDAGLFESPLVIPADLIMSVSSQSGTKADRSLHTVRAPAAISLPYGYEAPINAAVFLSTVVVPPRARARVLDHVQGSSQDPGLRTIYLWLQNPDDVNKIRNWLDEAAARPHDVGKRRPSMTNDE